MSSSSRSNSLKILKLVMADFLNRKIPLKINGCLFLNKGLKLGSLSVKLTKS